MSNSAEGFGEAAVAGCWGFTVVEHRAGRFRLVGELDTVSVGAVRDRFVRLGGDVELECSEVSFIGSSGLQLLLAIRAACEAGGGHLVLVNPSRCVVRLLALSGLNVVFTTRVDESWEER